MPHPLLNLGLNHQGSFYILTTAPASALLAQEGVPPGKESQAPTAKEAVEAAKAAAQGGEQTAGKTGEATGQSNGTATGTATEGTQTPGVPKKAPQPEMCGNTTLIMMGGMFVIVYFLMLRPQQKQEKAKKAMLAELGKGDKIVTTSGIHCEIVSVHPDEGAITVKFGNEAGQRFKIDRAAISRVQGGEPVPERKG